MPLGFMQKASYPPLVPNQIKAKPQRPDDVCPLEACSSCSCVILPQCCCFIYSCESFTRNMLIMSCVSFPLPKAQFNLYVLLYIGLVEELFLCRYCQTGSLFCHTSHPFFPVYCRFADISNMILGNLKSIYFYSSIFQYLVKFYNFQ